MTPDEPPLIGTQWPYLAAELVTALREEGETDLARKADTFRVLEQCDCAHRCVSCTGKGHDASQPHRPAARGTQPRSADHGSVEVVIGKVEQVEPVGSNQLAVTVAAPTIKHVIMADLVVCNFGRESDYTQVGSPLWKNLLAKHLVTPHQRTGRGIEIDDRGTPLRPDGEPITPLSAIGVMREGDEIVRNGRSGALPSTLPR